MRQAFLYYLLQSWAADPYRRARPDVPAQVLTPAAATKGLIRHATRSASR